MRDDIHGTDTGIVFGSAIERRLRPEDAAMLLGPYRRPPARWRAARVLIACAAVAVIVGAAFIR